MMQRRAKPPPAAAAAATMAQQPMPALFKRKKRSSSSSSSSNSGAGPFSEGVLLTALVVVFLLSISGGLVYEFHLYHSSALSSSSSSSSSASAEAAPGGGAVDRKSKSSTVRMAAKSDAAAAAAAAAAQPPIIVPVLPIFAPVPDAERYKRQTLDENNPQPSLAGIIAILQDFVKELHRVNQHALQQASALEICQTVFDLTRQHLGRFDAVYRRTTSTTNSGGGDSGAGSGGDSNSAGGNGNSDSKNIPIFPIRNDESIFMSLAAFREDLLADTMRFAFMNAQHPDKLHVGAVVQNCFGKVLEDSHGNVTTIDTTGLPCRTGVQVVGRNAQTGKDMTKVSDAPPDRNGIAEFCQMPDYAKYCQNGQVRVLYVHEMDSSGPAMARYLASKLWAGETYFLQTDSHLMFAEHWDAKYRAEVQAASSFPKAVLSSYPPGFPSNAERDPEHAKVPETPGARLCTCSTRLDDPNPIIRINTGVGYSLHNGELPPRPTQIPFIAGTLRYFFSCFFVSLRFVYSLICANNYHSHFPVLLFQYNRRLTLFLYMVACFFFLHFFSAGFFFARAEFLLDVPFDPFMPWYVLREYIDFFL
jgi:Glycosyltransferase (GlcNAc)